MSNNVNQNQIYSRDCAEIIFYVDNALHDNNSRKTIIVAEGKQDVGFLTNVTFVKEEYIPFCNRITSKSTTESKKFVLSVMDAIENIDDWCTDTGNKNKLKNASIYGYIDNDNAETAENKKVDKRPNLLCDDHYYDVEAILMATQKDVVTDMMIKNSFNSFNKEDCEKALFVAYQITHMMYHLARHAKFNNNIRWKKTTFDKARIEGTYNNQRVSETFDELRNNTNCKDDFKLFDKNLRVNYGYLLALWSENPSGRDRNNNAIYTPKETFSDYYNIFVEVPYLRGGKWIGDFKNFKSIDESKFRRIDSHIFTQLLCYFSKDANNLRVALANNESNTNAKKVVLEKELLQTYDFNNFLKTYLYKQIKDKNLLSDKIKNLLN